MRDAVIARDLHYALLVNPLPHPDLVLVRLFDDAMDFFVAATEPAADSRAEALDRIRRGPLIYSGRVAQCQELLGNLSAHDVHSARMLSCGDLELVKSLALAGLGVAVLPRRVAAYNASGLLRRLHPELPHIADTIYLAWRGDLHRTAAATRLKEALVSYARTMPAV